MKSVILLFLTCISGFLSAQTEFRKGKIIKINGDTISGELNFQGDIENSRLIQFRNQSVDTIYKPFDIESYLFENGKFYTSKVAQIETDTVSIFAEYLVRGKKDLFFFRSASGFHYLISESESVIKELPYKVEIVNIEGVNYQKESKLFTEYLKTYFEDCPSLFSRIEELKAPNRKSLIALTKEYHDITCGEGTCITYDRREYPVKIAIEPVYSFYLRKLQRSDTIIQAYGGNLYFWIPNSSERLFIKTGLIFTRLSSSNYLQIPLQFEYVFPFELIKPKFDLGINAHFIKKSGKLIDAELTTLLDAGCYVKLTNWMFLDLDISSDLFAFSYETRFFESFSIRFGLYIRFYN